jgi:hypothetical protein
MPKPADLSVTGLRRRHVLTRACTCQADALFTPSEFGERLCGAWENGA